MPTRPPLSKGTIGVLIVENEPFLLMDTADVFTDAGLPAFEARDADEAIIILSKRDDIRVVITDFDMPLGRMDGRALIRIILTRWPGIDVMVHSSSDTPKPGDLPAGVRFVPKPCHGQDLVSAAFAIILRQTGSI